MNRLSNSERSRVIAVGDEEVAHPISHNDAKSLADRMNRGFSCVAAEAALQIERELISDESETIGDSMAKIIDEKISEVREPLLTAQQILAMYIHDDHASFTLEVASELLGKIETALAQTATGG